MKIKLKYGKKTINVNLKKSNILDILILKKIPPKIFDIKSELKKSFKNPIGTPPLKKLIECHKPKNPVIILEDITRPNPEYPQILSILLEELYDAGMQKPKFVIAYGSHRIHTKDETKKLYGLGTTHQIIDHDCDNKEELVSLGKLSTGNELIINKTVAFSDFIITTGNIDPHSFAGFGGGRKAILPGVASRQTITSNHAMVVRDGVGMGKLEANPVHLEMLEAVKKVNVKFILNFIRNDKKEIIKVVSGNIQKAFSVGAKFAKKIYTLNLKKLADVIIVSPGGYPRDINLYQAQKSISAVSGIVKKGGTIILCAECLEKVGQKIFECWMTNYSVSDTLKKCETEIEVEGHRAYLTKKIMSNTEIIVISSISKEKVENMGFIWKKDINQVLEFVIQKHGNNFTAYVVKEGASILLEIK